MIAPSVQLSRLVPLLTVALLIGFAVFAANTTDYHVDPAGDDSANGTSAATSDTPQTGTDTVTITIPAGSPRIFGRLKISNLAQP